MSWTGGKSGECVSIYMLAIITSYNFLSPYDLVPTFIVSH